MKNFFSTRFWRLLKEYLRALLIIIPLAFIVRSFGYGLYRVPSSSMEPTMLVGERFFADKCSILFSAPTRGEIIAFNDPNFLYSNNALMRVWQHYVWGPRNFTKRIIGIPGDRVQGMVTDDGITEIYLNGQKLEEPYVNSYPLIPVQVEPEIWRTYDPSQSYDKQTFYQMKAEDIERVAKWFERRGRSVIRYPQQPLLQGQGEDTFDVLLKENHYWVMGDNRIGSCDSRAWGPLDGNYIHGKISYRLWSIDSESSWWIFDLVKDPLGCWKKFRWQRSFQKI